MDVRSLCPFRVASLVWQTARGGYVLTVVCKATLDLAPVASTLAHDQEDPNQDDNHWDDNPARSVWSPSDMAPFKPRGDVLLIGSAFAARGEPVASLVARLVVGELDKSIEVTGDRFFARDGSLHEGARFSKMPLRYERAAAGPDNPVGVRTDEANAYGTFPLPNLLPLGTHVASRSDFIAPTGFGPIAPSWRARAERLGAHAGARPAKSWTEGPLPEGLDPSYFNAAPRDQQVEAIRSDERIVLENLHPSLPRFATSLPGLRPQAFAEIAGRAPHELTLTCDTLWIDTDQSICTLTWRGQVPLEHPSQVGRVLVAMAQPGQRFAWGDVERLDRSTAVQGAGRPEVAAPATTLDDDDDDDRQRTVAPDEAARLRAALPFAPSMGGGGASSAGGMPGTAGVSAPRPPGPARERGTIDAPGFGGGGASSLSNAPPPWLAPPAAARPSEESFQGGGTSGAAVAPPAMQPLPVPQSQSMSAPVAASPWASGGALPSHSVPAPAPVSAFAPASASAPAFGSGSASASASASASVPAPAPVSAPVPAPVSASAPASASGSAIGGFGASLGSPPPLGDAARSPAKSSPWLTPSGSPSTSKAVQGSAVAASNAAAAATAAAAGVPSSAPTVEPQRHAAAAEPPVKEGPRELLDLLWFEKDSIRQLRGNRAWENALGESEGGEWLTLDKPLKSTTDAGERTSVLRILTRAKSLGPEELLAATFAAGDDSGVFSPPLVLLTGELQLTFDEIEALKAHVTAASPLAGTDKRLREALDAANEILKSPWQISSGLAEGLSTRIKEAFAQGSRTLPQGYLETSSERALLEQRRFQKRTILGHSRLRCLFTPAGGTSPVPVYFPESLATHLPMFQRFRAKIAAEAHTQQDQHESHPVALLALALGRLLPVPAGIAARPPSVRAG